jgi:hypothetical protein
MIGYIFEDSDDLLAVAGEGDLIKDAMNFLLFQFLLGLYIQIKSKKKVNQLID